MSGRTRALSSRKRSTCNAPASVEFAFNEPRHTVDGIEIRRDEVFILDGDGKGSLEKADELENAGGIDDSSLEERACISQVGILAEQEILDDKVANTLIGGSLHRICVGDQWEAS